MNRIINEWFEQSGTIRRAKSRRVGSGKNEQRAFFIGNVSLSSYLMIDRYETNVVLVYQSMMVF